MVKTIQVGCFRVDITPEKYGPLGGFGNDHERFCNTIIDRPLGTCIAITDQADNTVLLITTDCLHTNKIQVATIREAITEATGIPGDHIMIAATHTHSGPSINGVGLDATQQYFRHQAKQLTIAARMALEDRRPAQIRIGQQILTHMTFDRHYRMNDGTAKGTGFGSLESGYKDHLDKADEQMQLIRFVREDACDVVLINWQAHATFVGKTKEGILCTDYIGPLRDHLEGLTGCQMAFFQGACGNLGPKSRIEEKNVVEDSYIAYGRKLAEHAAEIMENAQPVNGGAIGTKQVQYKAMVNHTEDHKLDDALKAMEEYRAHPELPQAERREIMKKYGFNSYLSAGAIVNRARAGEYVEVELDALSIGDISFVTAPFEMFCSIPVHIKANTPYAMTFFMGYCNGSYSYLPDNFGFEFPSYEVRSCRFLKGTAEDIGKTHLKMLGELKEN